MAFERLKKGEDIYRKLGIGRRARVETWVNRNYDESAEYELKKEDGNIIINVKGDLIIFGENLLDTTSYARIGTVTGNVIIVDPAKSNKNRGLKRDVLKNLFM